MSLSMTCHGCGAVLTADTEDALAELGREHAVGHGHDPAKLTHDAAVTRVRHSQSKQAATSRAHTRQ